MAQVSCPNILKLSLYEIFAYDEHTIIGYYTVDGSIAIGVTTASKRCLQFRHDEEALHMFNLLHICLVSVLRENTVAFAVRNKLK